MKKLHLYIVTEIIYKIWRLTLCITLPFVLKFHHGRQLCLDSMNDDSNNITANVRVRKSIYRYEDLIINKRP